MEKKYIPRAIESEIKKAVNQFPVVGLTGPRQTGKTTTLKKLFPACTFITFDDPVVRSSAKDDPAFFLETIKTPCIIDEVQYVPEILPFIKMLVDKNSH
ncbi:MAG: AAA family ATPase [Spirochaetota bacterium]